MNNRVMRSLPFLGLVLFFSLTLFALAQAGGQGQAAGKAAAPQATKAANTNLVDVNGKKMGST
jgi:hypothetical protein